MGGLYLAQLQRGQHRRMGRGGREGVIDGLVWVTLLNGWVLLCSNTVVSRPPAPNADWVSPDDDATPVTVPANSLARPADGSGR